LFNGLASPKANGTPAQKEPESGFGLENETFDITKFDVAQGSGARRSVRAWQTTPGR
jgi:hypothetical protein